MGVGIGFSRHSAPTRKRGREATARIIQPVEEPTQRLDKWLWVSRFFKTRGMAAEAISGGKVHVEGRRVKPSRPVKPGARVRIRKGSLEWEILVRGLSDQRRPAPEASRLYEETPESVERRQREAERRRVDAAARPPRPGRPTKRDRRLLSRLKGK
ncbi:MAG: RNA-binding protein [Gammaproteobacteria bacterium]|nr:RNA-binding protein [Gammaproteobacteria bacterium]NIR82093.1 RNA-binding protein [Gammaproteobacteria bacterium]NIR89326.1 RNA-binding protein [Gammaproteobacteria bacterium]NIU03203.1 RNA-binding protein [Gammaproteobacteria bacterium]NIV50715.1 RNA-binding protein [Gammaproteobacteria bacterium]